MRPAGVSRIALSYAHAGATRLRLDRFSGSFSHYDGFALILIGMALIALSLVRFVRTGRMIDDQQSHSAGGVKVEFVLAVVLGFVVLSTALYFAL